MRFAAGLTITGIFSFIIIEALKILMVPVTAWVMAVLAVGLKVAVFAVVAVGGLLAVALAGGVGIFLYNRSKGRETRV
jgi:hypothetical protein